MWEERHVPSKQSKETAVTEKCLIFFHVPEAMLGKCFKHSGLRQIRLNFLNLLLICFSLD